MKFHYKTNTNRIIIDYAYSIAGDAIRLIAPLITIPYVSRVIGAQGLGTYAYTYAIANYFVLFAMLGVRNHGTRSMAAAASLNDKSKVFVNIYSVQCIAAIFSFIAYFVITRLVVKEDYLPLIYIQSLYIISALFDIDWYFYGTRQFNKKVIRVFIFSFVSVVLVFILINKSNDLPVYAAIMAGGYLLSTLLLWPIALKQITLSKPVFKEVISNIKPMAILFIPVISISLYKIMDRILLGNMSDMTQVGYFDNSEKIITIGVTVIGSFGTVMLPKMSQMVANKEHAKTKTYIRDSMEFIMTIAIAITFGIMGVAQDFSVIFWGKEFSDCASLLAGLALTVIIISWANVIRTQYLIPNKKDKEYIVSVSLGAVINLLLNLLLIPKYKAMGAVIATIAAEFIVALSQSISVRRTLDFKQYIKRIMFPLFAASSMYVTIRLISNAMVLSVGSMLVQIISGAMIYISLLLLYAFFNKESLLYRILLSKVIY
jgi:O-antigen/teichoic acid export membrane protein